MYGSNDQVNSGLGVSLAAPHERLGNVSVASILTELGCPRHLRFTPRLRPDSGHGGRSVSCQIRKSAALFDDLVREL